MTYLIAYHALWLVVALAIGITVGAATFERRRDRLMDLVTWAFVAAWAFLAFLAVTKVAPDRAGYVLELAVLLSFAYGLGCFVGWLLRGATTDYGPVAATAGGHHHAPTAMPAAQPAPVAAAARPAPAVREAGPAPATEAPKPASAEVASKPVPAPDEPKPAPAVESSGTSASEAPTLAPPAEAPKPIAEASKPVPDIPVPTAESQKPAAAVEAPKSAPAEASKPAPAPKEPQPAPAAAAPKPEPAAVKPAPAKATGDGHAGERPFGLAAPDGKADDLKRIRGIGPRNEARLHGLGIWHFRQIAAWTPENVEWVGSYLAFPGRIDREGWVAQAEVLATGAETEFSKRVDAGAVPSSVGDGTAGQDNVEKVEPRR